LYPGRPILIVFRGFTLLITDPGRGWREHGSKPGSGGVASGSITNADRRERLRQLALETIDLAKDPYFMKNQLSSYECKLCLTLHNNEGSYLAHTQGRRHQMNLARTRCQRPARDICSTASTWISDQ